MKMDRLFLCVMLILLAGWGVNAQSIGPNRVIRSKTIITRQDLVRLAVKTPGTFTDMARVIGMEARTILYPGRAILPSAIGPPSVVKRNQIVSLVYRSGGLAISAAGRALGRGGLGDHVHAMNLSSRATVVGVVTGPGEIRIKQ